jgi:UPF0755 protein
MAAPTLVREDPRLDSPRPRRARLVVALILFLALIAAGALALGHYRDCREPSGPHTPVAITVPEGTTGVEVVQMLERAGVIPCGGTIGNYLLRATGKADRIRAGSYTLSTNMSVEEAIEVLTTPPEPVPTVRATIPEGYTIEQTGRRVRRDLGIPTQEFLMEIEDGDWSLPPYLPEGKPSPEGFLFPKTYEFVEEDLRARAVVERLLDQFHEEAEALDLLAGSARLGYSPYEIVTIASMIEEEARVARDRALIAGVIYNRLRDGMPLGIDATLLYDDPTPDGRLSTSDLEYDSPYNTRLYPGLPPTPIASPGAKSLKAALHPEATKFYYYVLCGKDGGHRFAVTYRQHLNNVDACLG